MCRIKQRKQRTISSNPPPRDLKAAQETLLALYIQEASVETDLEFKDEEDFPDPNGYEPWRRRALEKLKHVRAQIKWFEKFERLHS